MSEPEADDTPRISSLFLESLREGRIDDARIQIEALDDVTPREPRSRLTRGVNCKPRLNPRPSSDGSFCRRAAEDGADVSRRISVYTLGR